MFNPKILQGLTNYFNGGGTIPTNAKPVSTGRTNIDDTSDIRDSIAALVAGGYSRLKSDDPNVKAHIGRILSLLPGKQGQDLLTHIVIQNSNPDFKRLNPEQRITQFYSINSNNPDTNAIIQKARSFGTGPLSGFRESPDVISQELQGNPLIVKK